MRVKINLFGKEQTITASKEVLNLFSSALSAAANEQARRGHDAVSEQFDNISDTIYYALKNTGYYDK